MTKKRSRASSAKSAAAENNSASAEKSTRKTAASAKKRKVAASKNGESKAAANNAEAAENTATASASMENDNAAEAPINDAEMMKNDAEIATKNDAEETAIDDAAETAPDVPEEETAVDIPEQEEEEEEEETVRNEDEAGNDVAKEAPASEGESVDCTLKKLIEPFTKEQLIEILKDVASADEELLQRIRETAEKDISHRKLFVHGLGWDATSDSLRLVFSQFGELEECTVITDKGSGKSKGYGFVTYKTMAQAQNALKEPSKKINNRMAFCQLASEGPNSSNAKVGATNGSTSGTQSHSGDHGGRKIYVAPVNAEISAEKLLAFFSKFGEVEEGPLGFDKQTGKSKGYALFVYKTVEGAKKALEEPNKSLDGYAMQCKVAQDTQKSKKSEPVVPQADLSLRGVGLNPVLQYNQAGYAGFGSVLGTQSQQLAANALNPRLLGSGLLGLYGTQASTLAYQGAPTGQYSLSNVTQTGTGSLGGINPYLRR